MARSFNYPPTVLSFTTVRYHHNNLQRTLYHLHPLRPQMTPVFLLLLVILHATLAIAAPLKASVAPQTGSLDDTFFLEVTARGQITAERPEVAESADFRVHYFGPQSITQIINGSVDQMTVFVFQLTPKREGSLQTPAVGIEVRGQRMLSEQLTVTVTDSTAAASPDPDLVLRQAVTPSTAYVGQQLTYRLEFMTAVPVAETTLPDLTIDAFRSEKLGDDNQSVIYERGREYRAIAIERALFPLSPGNPLIPERKLRLKKLEQTRLPRFPLGGLSPFDDPFFGARRTQSVTVRADAIPITILPLPPAPAGLVGWNAALPLVGATSISVSYDESPVERGASKTITVSLITEGSGASFKKGLLAPQPSYRVYEEPIESKTSVQNGKLVSHQSVRLTIVPLTPGPLQIGPLSLSYFDPETQSYQTASSREIRFEVTQSAGGTPGAFSTPATSTTQPTISTPPLNEPDQFEDSLSSRLIREIGLPLLVFGAVSIVSILGFILIAVLYIRRVRARRPQRLKYGVATAPDSTALSRAVAGALGELLSPGSPSVEGEGLKALVRRTIGDGGLQFEVLSFLDQLETARFAPPIHAQLDHTTLVETAVLLVERIAHYRRTHRT